MMSSQEHRAEAEGAFNTYENTAVVYREERMELLALSRYHATMAVYEGMYELLGDGSRLEHVMTHLMHR